MKSQHEQIYEYLTQGHALTALDALQKFGCMALSQRIGNLKRDGVPIESETIKLPNGKRVSRYKLGGLAHG